MTDLEFFIQKLWLIEEMQHLHKKKTGKNSKKKLLYLKRLEFKNVLVSHQYFSVFFGPSTLKSILPALIKQWENTNEFCCK